MVRGLQEMPGKIKKKKKTKINSGLEADQHEITIPSDQASIMSQYC
jgi:hypothetical protein